MKRSLRLITAIALVAALLMAGCSRSSSGRRTTDPEEARVRSADISAEAYGIDDAVDCAGEYLSTDTTMAVEMASDPGYTNGSSVTVDEGSAQTDRMLIRYVTISCETLNFTEVTNNIENQVAQLGGDIESKNFSGTGNAGDLRTASYTIRVTSEALDHLTGVIGTSATITSSNESTEDVTLTYADTQARIDSLRVEQETLNNLLAQATDLDIILQLQNELTTVRYQIESYESQLRVLENLSSYSTLTLYINEVLEETEPEEPHIKTFSERLSESFHDGLEDAKDNWESFVIDIAGSVIPLSVTIILIVAGIITIKIIAKKIRKKSAGKNKAAPVVNNDNKEGPEKKD